MKIIECIKNKVFCRKAIIFYFSFLILAILKLFIVWNNEILALNQPHDDLWFINSANHAYWFGTYTQMKFIHLPIFPLFIYFTHFTEVPLRIILELFFISSSFYLTYSLMKAGINKWLGPVIFVLMIFHPLSMNLFNHTLAETFYAPLLIFSIANLIMLWLYKEGKASIYFSFLTGISFSLLWFTRDENILITALFILIFFIILVVSYLEKYSRKKIFELMKIIIIIPIACIMLLAIIINSANYLTFGVFAPSELQGSGYKSAYKALSRIKPADITKFVPISTESREKAYQVSPTFNELRPILEDHSNFAFYWTKNSQGIDNEMAAGWFYWMLREAVYQTGYKTGESADRFYNQVALEVNQAIKDKKIESRVVLLNFIDPYFYKFLPDLPDSFLRIFKLFFDTSEPSLETDAPGLPGEITSTVDKMANRRQGVVKKTPLGIIQGWAVTNNEEITNITLKNPDGSQIMSTVTTIERPDVLSSFKINSPSITAPLNSGFSLQFSDETNTAINGIIEFVSRKDKFSIPLKSIKEGAVTEQQSDMGGKTLYFAIDSESFPKTQKIDPLKISMQHYIWKTYGNIIFHLTILSILFLILIIATYKYIRKNDLVIILLTLLFTIFTRVILFSVLDINSWNGAQPRYIFPVMPLYSVALLIIIYLGSIGLVSMIKDRRLNKVIK
jgi:hypothetical protein